MKVKIKKDLYQDFTDQVIKQMENNNMNWSKPFTTTILNGHHNVISKKPYQGMNCFSIGLSVHKNGFKSNEWATFNQWKNLGAKIKKVQKVQKYFIGILKNMKIKPIKMKKLRYLF